MTGNGLHPLLSLLGSGVRGLEGTEFLFSSSKFVLVGVDFALNLLRNGFSHLLLGHFFEGIHLLGEALQAVPNFGTLETQLSFDFGPDLSFSLSNIDERLVAHDLFSLVELAFELRGHFFLFAGLEISETFLHFHFKFKCSFFLEQVEVGLVGEALVAKMSVNF